MKLFEIQYISRYYEQKFYSSEIIKASSEDIALKKFAKLFDIKDYTKIQNDDFSWNENDWVSKFKCINEVFEVQCPNCNGTGKINQGKYGINI